MRPEDLAGALIGLLEWAHRNAPRPEAPVLRRLREHVGQDPADLPIVSRALAAWDRPNFQVAIDAWSAGREVEVVGLPVMEGYRAGLAELVRGTQWGPTLEVGAVEYVTVPLGEHESIACVESGFWLARGDEGPLVVMLRSSEPGMGESLAVEILAAEREVAEGVLSELLALMRERNVYRGRILELASRHFHGDEAAPLTVRTLPRIPRERIVLSPGVLERIERQAIGMAAHAERLRASGRHLRRGLLLHGPPGTGKTLTAMYLAGRMEGRTVVMLTGQSLGAVGASIDLATALEPAMVVLEDVDLVAMDRTFQPTNAILFELLNGMDGLDEDHDILFVLTTNRAEHLEPALAARPGRVDQAVELALPDADGRRRLLELYGEGLDLRLSGEEPLIAALEGSSPAFIRELLRRAALLAAEEHADGPLRVRAGHLEQALAELRQVGSDLTSTLLGAAPPGPDPASEPDLED
ncbi:MAG: Cell division protein FtsH [uncultured Solirubrobacteraceae bacterium]|uniref:Cell division protein FtsH n=1 Tax=uncultured Solirubrobacteraceae bacterium TaxID=1162706 RepID=A0A6J4SAT0_9ACTN|nr:MAG: Cell division protein FtsH [uncultured Solirubrobacteraceae bacterium]